MKNLILFTFFCQTVFSQTPSIPPESKTASDPLYSGVSPRLTTDHQGKPILTWAEEDDSSNVVSFWFARYDEASKAFMNKKKVRIVSGVSAHAEGMPKLAFKKDGTLIAIFETNRPVPDSRFSGDLLYTLSIDDGVTWSSPKYVHSDTTAGKSRSFSDISVLPNGEVGVVWLGEKNGKESGRPLKFAQSQKGQGLGKEITIKQGVCECCRTDLFVDSKSNFHIYFRDIMSNGARDIGQLVSTNQGISFGNYKKVYPDNWIINACPHAGPSSAELMNKLYTAWYTGEDKNVGIKLTNEQGQILTHIKTASARHPQLITHQNKLVLVWDQPSEIKTGKLNLQINMQLLDEKGSSKTWALTGSKEMANYPTILSAGKNLLVAYEEGQEKKKINYKTFVINQEGTEQR